MAEPFVLIVGAGPTGMTAAIELRRAGINVRIIDKSTHMAQYSQALIVQARTLEQFERYGVAEAAVAKGHPVTKANIWSDSKNILSFEFATIPSRYPYLLMLPQNETEAILNAYMESLGVKTERGVELVSLNQPEGLVTAMLRHADGSEEQVNPEWVIGCDGAHSVVRSLLDIPFEGAGIALSFFLGDLDIEGPDAPQDELSLHFHHGDVVFMARLPNKLVRLIVAGHEQQNEVTKRELTIKDFQDALDHAGVKVMVKSAAWTTPFRVNDRQAQNYRAGSVFLAGDASHIHSPVGGQGMNTGIQDAANLCWKLAAVMRGADDRLLDSYEAERAPVGKALLHSTERGLKMGTTKNALFESIRDTLLPILASLKPVQKGMLGFISETAIEYRSSSAVVDHGGDGDLRAGDRMPDLTLRSQDRETSLLHDWTEAKHLAFIVMPADDGAFEEVEAIRASLTRAHILVIPTTGLSDEGRRILGVKKKLIIVRPDGYIGFRGTLDHRESWMTYARQDALLV